jgi:fatty-acid desaturase
MVALAVVGWFIAQVLMGLGNTIGYHRLLTHRAFATVQPLWLLFTFLGALHSGGPMPWIALHRLHHTKSDGPEDPITPKLGFFNAQGGFLIGTANPWLALPFALSGFGQQAVIFITDVKRIAGTYTPEWHDACPDLREHWFIRLLDVPLVITAMFLTQVALAWFIGGWWGLLWLWLLHLALTNGSWAVNSLGHTPSSGRQDYDNPDQSTNVPWLAAITFGEGYHNNHHRYPRSAWNALGPGPDVSWYIIRGLVALGLAWDVWLPKKWRGALPERALKGRR